MLKHCRDNVWLRDGLSIADGERVIFVGMVTKSFGNELVTRHLSHRLKHPYIADAALRKLQSHHFFALKAEGITVEGRGHDIDVYIYAIYIYAKRLRTVR
jgi:hypothetical protein